MVDARDFVELYGGTVNSVYQAKKDGNKYVLKKGKYVYVDDKKLIKRKEFMYRIKQQNQDNYYRLKELGLSDVAISNLLYKGTNRAAHTWRMYMGKTLFSSAYQNRNLLVYKINKMDCEFNKVTRRLLR